MIKVETAKKWLDLFIEQLLENKVYLSELDTAIGDGDHGNNMARGATALKEKLAEKEYDNLTDLLKDTGMVMVSKVGGASGPLYGSAFIEMAKAAKNDEQVALADLLQAGLDGIQKRGKAAQGEKTMVDEWIPVIEDVQNNQLTTEKVDEYVEKTKPIKATKGRASYLGERSIGHIDPGAASSGLLFKTMLKAGVADE
ncbi:dihydroxyacetone kinase DhaL subunit [Pisciglobus halotolerans]|uniref:phosphoenolpyruvate--glycerone phosphotransferase n=1 Tax=Pisciglobus halotolerans TaxID=745365 RepID=A0A1I3DR49_9LACT|nr:dihydroxyacetone kinase subunit DhaL [Pisciglobus halotolerans]SFH89217.1 dihydroxyacetone kinase DhaL subunit [Pisciglobus halotolerans]